MNSPHHHERVFGIVLSLIVFVIGLWPLIDEESVSWPWAGGALVLLLAAIFIPSVYKPLYKLWMVIGHVLGIINTHLVLAIAFYIFITPLALFFKLIGRDALHLKGKRSKSYWLRENKKWPADSFKNQF